MGAGLNAIALAFPLVPMGAGATASAVDTGRGSAPVRSKLCGTAPAASSGNER
jgi:hypothetical protein